METTPFTRQTRLTGYMPLPRQVLTSPLSSTAKLAYAVLLDRATLSQRSPGYAGADGAVYVVYPIEKLARRLGRGESTVKRCLDELEAAALLSRKRQRRNAPNLIFLRFPTGGFQAVQGSENELSDSSKMDPLTAQKWTPINKRDQNKNTVIFYRQGEGESL